MNLRVGKSVFTKPKRKKKKKEVASLKIQHDVGERKGSLDVAGIK